MASKSELIIANKLTALGIEYEYEKELLLNGYSFKPDFTVYTQDGRVLYWEHAGMLEDPEYQRRHEDKIAIYARHGIHLQDQLIVTRDRNGALDMDEVVRTIDYYRLRD